MGLLDSFVSMFSRFASIPATILNLLLSNYFLMVFCGGLIFFILNTPQADLEAIYDAFYAVVATPNGSFANVISAIVKACEDFAANVQHNYNPAALSDAVSNGVCKSWLLRVLEAVRLWFSGKNIKSISGHKKIAG